jgi:hypothetical protein
VAYVYRLMQRHERRRGPAGAKPLRKLEGEEDMSPMQPVLPGAIPAQNQALG